MPVTDAIVNYYRANQGKLLEFDNLSQPNRNLRMTLERDAAPDAGVAARLVTEVNDIVSLNEVVKIAEIALPCEQKTLRYKILSAYAQRGREENNGLATFVHLDPMTRASLRVEPKIKLSCLTFLNQGQYDSLTEKERNFQTSLASMMISIKTSLPAELDDEPEMQRLRQMMNQMGELFQ